MVVPSVPRIPTVGEVAADPIGINAMLGTYTNFVNLLDLAALTTPVGPVFVDGPPTSLTLIGRAWSDDLLVAIASSLGPEGVSQRLRRVVCTEERMQPLGSRSGGPGDDGTAL